MTERLEEEPEPDEDPEEEPAAVATAARPLVPSIGDGGREFEYQTDLLTTAEVIDGSTLAGRLTKASGDGWELGDIINAGARHALLLRRANLPWRNIRPVASTPPR